MSLDDALAALPAPRRAEAERLDALFRSVTGWTPRLHGRVIGYGRYHYRYASGREGDSFATGFNPFGREISLHIMPGYSQFPDIAAQLGPHRRGKSCWYLRRLDGVDCDALRNLIRAGLADLARQEVVMSVGA